MPVITRALLRKRAEHNECIISTLEEVSLHQEELENINEVLGATCRRLKILYLQNNIIPKIENLVHLKELEYINLALNNIQKIEGLQNCEFLKKLDLTVNFIDFDALKESLEHLSNLKNLRILYMMGNPSEANWEQFKTYVIAKVPQLESLDGTDITRSMKIIASQSLDRLEAELEILAERVKLEKLEKIKQKEIANVTKKDSTDISNVKTEDVIELEIDNDAEKLTENTPETRVEIYQEFARQKKEKEERENVNKPKERDYHKEQIETLTQVREREQSTAESDIKQKNEGGWEFCWDEDSKPGYLKLEVKIARFLDSSLIDVDCHPTYISIVIKSKTLRLRLPCEVRSSESKCQRSKTSGSLLVIMPKVNPKDTTFITAANVKSNKQRQIEQDTDARRNQIANSRSRRTGTKKLSLHEEMMAAAVEGGETSDAEIINDVKTEKLDIVESSKLTDYTRIVKKKSTDDNENENLFDTNTDGIIGGISKITELD